MADSEYRILIAEDNEADVYLIDEALRRHGFPYRLEVADNGEDMLNTLERIEHDMSQPCPDLFLVDLNLPRRPGYDVLAQIREGRRCGHVPVIIITSSNSPQDRARAKELGASFYFRKPPDLERFMAIGGIVREFLPPQPDAAPAPAS
jgi:CheY-like chemotaxis protein